jgi:hypothetical protein
LKIYLNRFFKGLFRTAIIMAALSGCANHFEQNFIPDKSMGAHPMDLCETSSLPEIHISEDIETEALGLMEEDYLFLGASHFNCEKIPAEKQSKKFAEKIGAGVVLLNSKFDRTTTRYETATSEYPASALVVNHGTVYPYGVPALNYNVKIKDGDVVSEDFSYSTLPMAYYHSSRKHHKSRKKRHKEDDDDDDVVVVMPTIKVEQTVPRQVDLYTYHASFWARTNYPHGLGVHVGDLEDGVKKTNNLASGVRVRAVSKSSPASRAPIYRNDILLSLNGIPIENPFQLQQLIRKNAGNEVVLEIIRDDEFIKKALRLNSRSW